MRGEPLRPVRNDAPLLCLVHHAVQGSPLLPTAGLGPIIIPAGSWCPDGISNGVRKKTEKARKSLSQLL
jgi:hypothetical protein